MNSHRDNPLSFSVHFQGKDTGKDKFLKTIISTFEADSVVWKCLDFVECSKALFRSNHNLFIHEKYSITVNILRFVFYNRGTTVYNFPFQMIPTDFWSLCGRTGSGGPNVERIG